LFVTNKDLILLYDL